MSVEPNNIISDANDSGVSSEGTRSVILSGKIEPQDDVDLYRFQANAGDEITFDIDAAELGSELDSKLRLFDATGNELDNNDDNPAPGEELSRDSYLTFNPDNSGDYYVGVSSFSNFAYDPIDGGETNQSIDDTGDYELEISFADQATAIDADNTISKAIATELDSAEESATFSDEIDSDADIDWFQLDAGDIARSHLSFDIITGTNDADILYGNADSTLIEGLDGSDVITGGGNNDYFTGDEGSDVLSGNDGDDTLIGGNGFDLLSGGAGADILQGDEDSNILFGGTGEDVFVIAERNNATNTISDFEDGIDKIKLGDGSSFADLIIDDIAGESSVAISSPFGSGVTTVLQVSSSNLSAEDFLAG